MVLGVGVNFEQIFGMFDFKGWYLGFILTLLLLVRRFRITGSMLLFFLVVAIPSLVAVLQGLYGTWKPLFIFGFFALLLMYSDALVRALGHDAIVALFAKAGLVHACFVLLNEAVYIVSPGLSTALFGDAEAVSFFTRANGLFLEPSEAALYLSPALAYYFLKREHRPFLVVLLAMILTFSSLTYVAIGLFFVTAIFLRRLSPFKRAMLSLIPLVLVGAAVTAPQIADRIDTIARIDMRALDFENYNSSVATVVMNSIVAVESLFGSAFLGIGFGNFEYGFNTYAEQYFPSGYSGEGLFWNRNTGGSLLVRATAELGLLGMAMIGYVLYRLGRAYLSLRNPSPAEAPFVTERQAYVVSSIILFAVCLLRKDSLTNAQLLVFIVGSLMLPVASARRRVPRLGGAKVL